MANSIAARIAVLSNQYGGFYSFPSESSPESTTATGLRVELFIDESWVDISSDVLYASRVAITGGRPSESSALQRGTCRFTLDNRDRRYAPKNPSSPYYGKIGRNTRCRVSTFQGAVRRYRFYGEISAWPQSQDKTGTYLTVQIEASGILRRLNQAESPLQSAMYRVITRDIASPVVAYWPMEDEDAADAISSAIPGIAPMDIDGTVDQATYSGFKASKSVPTFGVGRATGTVPTYTVTGETQVRFFLVVPAGGLTDAVVLCSIRTTGTAKYWELIWDNAGSDVTLLALDINRVVIGTSSAVFNDMRGVPSRISIEMVQNGADVDTTISFYGIGVSLQNHNTTFTSMTVGRVTNITLAPNKDITGTVFGHLSLQINQTSSFDIGNAITGYNGESPGTRIGRLCAEEGIDFQQITNGQSGNFSGVMGPQLPIALPALIQQCVDSDLGMLYEPRDRFGLEYRTRLSLYNRDPHLTLDYAATDLFEPLVGVPDDLNSQNDIEVKRDTGGSARAVLESGALSIQLPPNGIGRYDTSVTLSLQADSQLVEQAGFRLRLGTVDESRYPGIIVHLNRPNFLASYDLTAAALTTKIGDRVLVQNPPDQETPDDISVLVQSFEETIDQFEHVISFNGAPESPYHVAVADGTGEFVARVDTGGSTLLNAISETDTSIQVLHSSPKDRKFWGADDQPFDLLIGGEVVTATTVFGPDYGYVFDVSGWTPQDCTVVQSATHTWRGDFAALVTVVGTPTQAYIRPIADDMPVVVAGDSYTASMWVYSVAGYSAIVAAIDWFDAGGNYLSTSFTSYAIPAAQWTYITVTGNAPISAVFAGYGPTISGSPAAGTAFWVDEVLLSPHRTQKMTVTRSVNGVVKAQSAGTDIELTQGAFLAL